MTEIHKISYENLTSWDKITPFSNSENDEDDIISNNSSSNNSSDEAAIIEKLTIGEQFGNNQYLINGKDTSGLYNTDSIGKMDKVVHETAPFPIDHMINEKIIFWIGDVWRLDTDAIIYPNNTHLSDRDGICGPIFYYGGREIINDIKLQNGSECRIGESIVTGAGKLPARFVIHSNCPTFNPKYLTAAENALNSCYRSSLEIATEHNLKTLGLACIHNDTKHFPPVLGAHIALRTIRRYLERYGQKIDKIVLSLVNIIDIEIYKKILPMYFPRTTDELEFQQRNLPKEHGDKNGELVSEDRKIRIKSLFRNFDDDYIEQEDEINDFNPFSNNNNNNNNYGSSDESSDDSFISKKDDPDVLKKKKKVIVEEIDNPIQSRFKYYLNLSKSDDFSTLENSNFMFKTMDSTTGRPIIVIIGSNLEKKDIHLDLIHAYFIKTLETLYNASTASYQPFSIIYFHSGTSKRPLPEIIWFKTVLEIFEYRYSKYLTTFNVVHPSFFLKASFLVLKAFSIDVMDKLVYHDNLNNLKSTVSKLNLPKAIFASEIKRNDISDYAFVQEDDNWIVVN
ncbi:ganglioside induced differentiation associated protein 2 [Cavenderia fasciculata]|uniref:Ganglioside induced differentiation associated protein 2 n=1 Tax=Cavenderia fasciculata TaxID=261658 RepID=F4Q995_CACFS|nr:ganglioside induced differentiation associated protein 2 [Cavenderia fasciculata]EGG15264.1 ganglioside induced differentiation associated protein 2 [Cavenderia fasciculata]|eukprot:XP_004351984.1 ganglioside induced differentiation associated protein 2 [Cavenderia fasciculata]